MYKFYLKNVVKAHQYEELIKIFLKPEQFVVLLDEKDVNCSNVWAIDDPEIAQLNFSREWSFTFEGDANLLKKEIYLTLAKETGEEPKWGIITGIRPVKLFGETVKANQEKEDPIGYTAEKFRDYYCVSQEKTDLTTEMYKYQMEVFGEAEKNSVGLYIGIPFCPTRCLYCSFTSNQVTDEKIEEYLVALHKEIDFVAEKMRETGIYAESIYIGGGTPTTLNEVQLEELLKHVNDAFKTEKLREFTVEAGRPDTITDGKLRVIKEADVERISINPQTMNDKTLELIGRNHNSDQIRMGFELAKKNGIEEVNADLIVGLPEETLEDFIYSLEEVIALDPENITVHTLAVKRASRLVDVDKDYHYKQAEIATKMMEYAYKRLDEKGYKPYYLYRQKAMAGAGENIGFCKAGTENLYNARIMDEHQSILALGAGGISKVYFPEENRLERVPNVSNYEIYMERIDEMLHRKQDKFFEEVKKC